MVDQIQKPKKNEYIKNELFDNFRTAALVKNNIVPHENRFSLILRSRRPVFYNNNNYVIF